MVDAMDQSIDPCDDFFEYACGSWNRKNVIPDDKSNYNTFGKLRDDLQVLLKGRKGFIILCRLFLLGIL